MSTFDSSRSSVCLKSMPNTSSRPALMAGDEVVLDMGPMPMEVVGCGTEVVDELFSFKRSPREISVHIYASWEKTS